MGAEIIAGPESGGAGRRAIDHTPIDHTPIDRTLIGRTLIDRRAIPAGAVESRWIAADGHAIRRVDWAAAMGSGARGSLLFLPGRGDAYEKYLESLAHWRACGWAVTSIDWRWQAGSGRGGGDETTGHIDDFSTWIDDLAHFWGHWRVGDGPRVIVAHSMGGHLALRALALGRVDPAALVLTAPMLGVQPGRVPAGLLHRVARLFAGHGDARRAAWRAGEKPGALPAKRIHLLTHDAARYADELWWHAARPELAMGAPSWGWMERALASIRALAAPGVLAAVTTPVLLLCATHDRLVDPRAIVRAARALPRGELIEFGREAAHELLRESDGVRDRVLAAIDAFLTRVAPAREP